jgi:hypothetical protein
MNGTGRFEVHEHSFVSGPRSSGPSSKFSHSHDGGSEPHQHPNTGPASYTIDRDEWRRMTGLIGGARKQYTFKASGEQLPIVALSEDQKAFEVIVVGDGGAAAARGARGPGVAPAARMMLQFGMKAVVK